MSIAVGEKLALGKTLAISAVLAATFLVVSASAESKARIVRLSEVQGIVQLDRVAGDGFDKAFVNLPVIEGSRLRTGKNGRAEVEFEDGSALRLAPESEIDFTHLALGDDGQKLSAVQLVSGTVYADIRLKTNGKAKTADQFQLNFAHESVAVADAAHFRVEFGNAGNATLAVFKGKVSATSPSGQFDVAEKHSATIGISREKDDVANKNNDAASDANANADAKKDTFVVAKNYADDPSDGWDRQQTDYHDRYAATGNSSISSPYAYGMSDLNYYGSFMTVPGYGNVWQPYFVGANWSPFQDGGWASYPGAGYMWVSGYPWGWMPYNYGNWAFAPGYGYVWQPGNWNTWNALPLVVNAPARMIVPAAPATGRQTVMVGRGLAANPATGAPSRVTINPDSAGFGVPRGSVNHLDRLAKTMQQTSRPMVASTVAPERPFRAAAPAADFGMRGIDSPGMAASSGATHKTGASARP